VEGVWSREPGELRSVEGRSKEYGGVSGGAEVSREVGVSGQVVGGGKGGKDGGVEVREKGGGGGVG